MSMKEQIFNRFRNKAFLLALASAIIILVQQVRPDIVPANLETVINTVLGILTVMGIVIDPTTPGLADGVVVTETPKE